MTGCPHFSLRTCANLRANTSVAPPGVCGTTNFTVRVGNGSAAQAANGLKLTKVATSAASDDWNCMAVPPRISLGCDDALENVAWTTRDNIARQRQGRLWCRCKTSGSAQV